MSLRYFAVFTAVAVLTALVVLIIGEALNLWAQSWRLG